MKKYFITIIIFVLSCTPTEPVGSHDDAYVLQNFIDNSLETLNISLDTNNNGVIEPLELGEQTWENGRIMVLNCNNIGLSGNIPESIGNLTELTQLGLKNNNLIGEIPENIGKLVNLTQLSLADNTLSGIIPYTIGNLQSLTRLDLSNNEFSGSIPNSITNLTILHTFLADSNNLSGIIPDDLCTIYPNFIDYDFVGNQFCPPLPNCLDSPDEIGFQNCATSCGTEYEYINGYCYSQVDLNVLQTMIDDSDSLNMVMDIDNSNVIDPLELGIQGWSSGRLETLDCYWENVSCNLSISLLGNISDLDSLQFLDLEKNNLQGNLVESLFHITNLELLNITDNQFSGYLSEDICNINSVLLGNNHFCPCYPECIAPYLETQDTTGCSVCDEGYLPICNDLNANHTGNNNLNPHNFINFVERSICFNQINLDILQEFIDSSSATLNMDIMDINSSENIEPLELGDQLWIAGDLISLKAGYVELSGGIPASIEHLNNLDILYLHENQLSGYIPDGICELTNLQWSADSTIGNNSLLYNNKLCPPYPDCILPYVGVQDTTECQTGDD